MHHTFNPHRVVQQKSSEQCKGFLTVDCLLHEGNLLDCECNNIAWEEIKNALGVSRLQEQIDEDEDEVDYENDGEASASV
ncbi:hypothetical protein KUCAC02_013295 [Chaenocephalus aceratus]|nr:hypothetical protein KUCAC02_013295 [Chaenocephalus aceratus]